MRIREKVYRWQVYILPAKHCVSKYHYDRLHSTSADSYRAVRLRGTHLHRNFQTVSMTGIPTTPMEIGQCQPFDGLLTRKSATSPHGGPVDSLANNIATFTISLSNNYDSGRKMWQKLSNALTIPVSVSDTPAPVDSLSQHAAAAVNEPVTLFLPGGIRMCCHPSQLTDVFRALRYTETR